MATSFEVKEDGKVEDEQQEKQNRILKRKILIQLQSQKNDDLMIASDETRDIELVKKCLGAAIYDFRRFGFFGWFC